MANFKIEIDGVPECQFNTLWQAEKYVAKMEEEEGINPDLIKIVPKPDNAGFEFVVSDEGGDIAAFNNEGDVEYFIEQVENSEGFTPDTIRHLENGIYEIYKS
jgi:hypothetical protein